MAEGGPRLDVPSGGHIMRFGRTHDASGFVLYIDTEPPGPHVKSYIKVVLSPNRADALHRALTAYLSEAQPPATPWLPADTDG